MNDPQICMLLGVITASFAALVAATLRILSSDVATIRADVRAEIVGLRGGMELRFDRLENRFDGLDRKVDGLDRDVQLLMRRELGDG